MDTNFLLPTNVICIGNGGEAADQLSQGIAKKYNSKWQINDIDEIGEPQNYTITILYDDYITYLNGIPEHLPIPNE